MELYIKAIEVVLKAPGSGDKDFVFAVDRHEALAKAIGLPYHTVGYEFRYISDVELPQGIKPENIIRTNG